jgi:hypothetical protein
MIALFDAPKLDNLNYHATNLCKLQNQITGTYDATNFVGSNAGIILNKYRSLDDNFKEWHDDYSEWLSN